MVPFLDYLGVRPVEVLKSVEFMDVKGVGLHPREVVSSCCRIWFPRATCWICPGLPRDVPKVGTEGVCILDTIPSGYSGSQLCFFYCLYKWHDIGRSPCDFHESWLLPSLMARAPSWAGGRYCNENRPQLPYFEIVFYKLRQSYMWLSW